MSKNIGNYVDGADFMIEVFPKVYWVPVCSIGKSRYNNKEIEDIIKLTPEEKCEKITNLYEALQLFTLSSFKGTLDNKTYIISEKEEELELWQTHTGGREALVANEGCCATNTHWLSYLLHDKYDSIGCFCYSSRNGNGHVTNYIKHNNWYYFIDLMMCRQDCQIYGCSENGYKEDVLCKEWAGSLFKCRTPLDFVRFSLERFASKGRDVPVAFYLRNCQEATATGVKMTSNNITFLIPKEDNPEILYLDKDSNVHIEFVELPVVNTKGH